MTDVYRVNDRVPLKGLRGYRMNDILEEEKELFETNNPQQLVTFGGFTETNTISQSKKIMIVDDEGFNLIALEGILSLMGYSDILKAFDGQQALAVIKDKG